MRHIKRGLCLWVLLLLPLAGCASPASKPGAESGLLAWPSQRVTLWVSSDLHWQEAPDAVQIPYLEEIIETLLDEAAQAGPQALLLCGDLTNSGRLEMHQAIAARLKGAQEKGLKVFVAMGNHDMDRAVPAQTLTEIYAPFGWEQAISRDEGSMSYLAPLTDELWLLSLDSNRYGDRGDGVGGIITGETLSWVAACLERAGEAGAMVVPFGHHNLMAQGLTERNRSQYNIEGGEGLQELFLDWGVPLYFSGHQHGSALNQAAREGRQLIESVVPIPSACPYYCTVVTFEPDSTVKYSLQTLDVEAWAGRTGREEPEFFQFTAKHLAQDRQQWEALAIQMTQSMDIPAAHRAAMADFFVDFMMQRQSHSLWREGERLRRDPAMALWASRADENNYARWIPWVLENGTNDATEQTFGPFREGLKAGAGER